MENIQEDNFESSLKFIDYIVDSVEFFTNKDFDGEEVSLNFSVKREIVVAGDNDEILYVTLHLNIFDQYKEKNYPFNLKLSLTGVFETSDISTDQRMNLAEVNAVAILFPYARALVSSYSANANVPPLVLPAINIIKLIEQQAK